MKSITVNLGSKPAARPRSSSKDREISDRKRLHTDSEAADQKTEISAPKSTKVVPERPRQRSDRQEEAPETPATDQRDPSTHTPEERGRSKDRGAETAATDDYDDSMVSLMGFSGFGSTKGKHVAGTKSGGAEKTAKSQYRQYMNRSKGFNRPLSPSRK